MSEPLEVYLDDEPALIVTTGRGEWFRFADDGPMPRMTDLGAAVLITRLRWWADRLEAERQMTAMGAVTATAPTTTRPAAEAAGESEKP